MTLKNIELESCYDSDQDDVLNDFYIPVLKESVEYKRLAGFFSSTALAVAAKGIRGLLENDGKMKLIAGAVLSKQDVDAIREAHEDPEKVIEKTMIKDLSEIEDEFVRDHVRALSWLVANKKLEIKIAIVTDDSGIPLDKESIEQRGIFHQKVGILEDDEGNRISFSGSDNESASGWQYNIEEFKVFRDWVESEKVYLTADFNRFKKFWDGTATRTKVIEVPIAVKERLIEIAPNNIEKLNLERWSKKEVEKERKVIKLWDHQNQAIIKWLDNDKKGIFEMATGTGKTFAALGCLKEVLEDEEKLITVIACPYDHLVKQWLDDINDFGITSDTIIADSTNPNWKNYLADYTLDIKIGNKQKLIVLTTHASFCSGDFIDIIRPSGTKSFLIVDEVHGAGALERKKGLIEDYEFRLGLSATPERYYDADGTEDLLNYFGGAVFEFPLKEAIREINPMTGETYLVPYEYKVHFVELTEDELIEYRGKTQKIRKMYHQAKDDEERGKNFDSLCSQRANIIKGATNKYKKFEEIIDQIDDLTHCLIFCSPQSPQQINRVKEIIDKKNVIWHEFTQDEGSTPKKEYGGLSEREFLLKDFADGGYQVLVSMTILDEGVDVPPARIAIMLSSSSNPRQYVQRRGRILRHYPGKDKATIHDIIVIPRLPLEADGDFLDLEKTIIKREMKRYKEFSDAAINKLECLEKIDEIEEKYGIILWG